METRRWLNQSQPQTLQIAVFLLYFNAFWAVVDILRGAPFAVVILGGCVAAGYGIANELRWGYLLGIGMSLLPFILRIAFGSGLVGGNILNFVFEVALVVLLLHPQSRDYQRIWFS